MKDNQHIDQLFRQKLEHYEKQPAAHNWDTIEHGIRGRGFGDHLAKGFALLGLLAFIYVGYDSWVSTSGTDTEIASIDEMIDYELQKEMYALQELHTVDNSSALLADGLNTSDEMLEKIEIPMESQTNTNSIVEHHSIEQQVSINKEEAIASIQVEASETEHSLEELSVVHVPETVAKVVEPGIAETRVIPVITTESSITPTLSEEVLGEISKEPINYSSKTSDIVLPIADKQIVIDELTAIQLYDENAISEADLVQRDFLISNIISKKGFYTGTIGSGHNSWILNNKAEEASAAENLDYKLDFGVAYGLIAGYDFSEHWGVEAEWIINSKQGQKYENNYLSTGIVSEEEVDLNYMHFPVFVKYRNQQYSDLFKAPRTINVLFGPQYSVVQESTTSFNNGLVVIEELVNTKEFGMSLGLEYNVSIKNNLDVGLGARSSISTDINMFPRPFSKDLEKSNNLLIGVNAGIRYYPFH